MATYSKVALSGAANGKAVKVVATGSTGTTIHTATANVGAGQFDEVWLWAYNSDASPRLLTIQFGGVATPDNDIKMNIPSQAGLTLVVPGLILNNTLVVAAYAALANVITLSGYVNRIT